MHAYQQVLLFTVLGLVHSTQAVSLTGRNPIREYLAEIQGNNGSLPENLTSNGIPEYTKSSVNATSFIGVHEIAKFSANCPASNVFPGITAGVSGYDLPEGDIYNDKYDPGFRQQIFKAYRTDRYGCFKSASGINVIPWTSCLDTQTSYSYDNYNGFLKASQEASSSSKEFQLGLETEVKIEIPDTKVEIKTTIPPKFTRGSGDSKSSSDMEKFFRADKGYSVTSHADCILYIMKVDQVFQPPFEDAFSGAIRMLFAAIDTTPAVQRNTFLRFLTNYGTHFFTEIKFGAKVALTQKYSNYTTQRVGRKTLDECTKKKSSFLWFSKKESSTCSASDEQSLKQNGGSEYSEIITAIGSAPPENGGNWFAQDFIPAPLKFQLSPIVNLFTDASMASQSILSFEGAPVNALQLRKAYAPLYYNYCGAECVCFIRNCVQCTPTGDACETCLPGYVGSACTNTMYIISRDTTETFTLNITESASLSLTHRSSKPNTGSTGCEGCAFSRHGKQLYLAGGFETRQTALVHHNGSLSTLPDLPSAKASNIPFSFIVNERQYVAGLNTNHKEVYSRYLSNLNSWRREVDLPIAMDVTARSAVVTQGVVYVTGGADHDLINRAWTWRPGQTSWHELPSMQNPLTSNCNVLVDNRIFVFGGGQTTSVEVYDTHWRSWSHISLPDSVRLPTPICVAVDTDVYILTRYSHIYSSMKVYRYNTVKDAWTVLHTFSDRNDMPAMWIV